MVRMAAVGGVGGDDRPTGKYASLMTAGAAWPGVPAGTMEHYVSVMNSYVAWSEPHIQNLQAARQDIRDCFGGDYFENAGVHDAADRVLRTGHQVQDDATAAAKWTRDAASKIADTKSKIRDAVSQAQDDIDSIDQDTGLTAAEKEAKIAQKVSEVHAENVAKVTACAASINVMPMVEPLKSPFADPGPGNYTMASGGTNGNVRPVYFQAPIGQNPAPQTPNGGGNNNPFTDPSKNPQSPPPNNDHPLTDPSQKPPGKNPNPKVDPAQHKPDNPLTDPSQNPLDDNPLTDPSPPPGAPPGQTGPMPQMPMSPVSPMSSPGSGVRPPSLPSTGMPPLSPATGAGGSTPVSPAAFNQPLAPLANNMPPAGSFTPPPAAASTAGPIAPMTPAPQVPETQAPPPAAPPPAAAPAAAAPGPAPMSGMPMAPPMMAAPLGGAPASPPPMSAPPPVPSPPVAPAAAGPNVNASLLPLTANERVTRDIKKVTRDAYGEASSTTRSWAAALMAATKKRWPEMLWCVGGRRDPVNGSTVVVANNIGLGFMPAGIALKQDVVYHAFIDGAAEIDWVTRREWIGDPVRAVLEFGRRTAGEPVTILAGSPQLFAGRDDLSGIPEVYPITEMPATGPTGYRDRLMIIDEQLWEQLAALSVDVIRQDAGLTAASALSGWSPDSERTKALWQAVVSAAVFQSADATAGYRLPVDQHLEAWRAFCEDQVAVSEHRVRTVEDPEKVRQWFADFHYWRWNLDQLAQEDQRSKVGV